MAIQTFTSGQTLTAAQMTTLQQNDYNWSTSAQTASYVLVAADAGKTVTMTNAGATTITVNTSLFTAGDTVRILNLGAGACTITAGTATVNTAGSLVLPQYGSGTLWFSSASAAIFIPDDRNSGLTFITGATFTTVTSFSLPNNTFTSTYDNYKVIIDVTNISATQTLSMRLRASGTDNTTSNYYQSSIGIDTIGTSRNLLVNAGTSFNFGGVLNTFPEYASFAFDVIAPNLARTTELHGTLNWSAATYFAGAPLVGGHTSTTQFDAFSVIVAGGATFSGTYRIYGYQNS